MSGPPVNPLGKVVAESDGRGWLVMLPNGDVTSATTKTEVEELAQGYAKRHHNDDAINVLVIVWQ